MSTAMTPDTCPHCGGTGRKPLHGGCVTFHGRNLPHTIVVDDLRIGGACVLVGPSWTEGGNLLQDVLMANEHFARPQSGTAARMQEAFEILSHAAEPQSPNIKRALNMAHEAGTHPSQQEARGTTVRTQARMHGRKHKAPRVQRRVIRR